jgi:hypothetical protein
MATSRVPATIDALVALFTAAGLTTWDGPLVTGDYQPAIHVGYDGDPEGDFKAVDADQEWAGIGAKSRDEEFDVICCAITVSGNSDIRSAREAAFAMLAVVENALRVNPSLGQAPPFVAAYRPAAVHTEPTAAGWSVRAVFNVHVKTRI